MGTNEPVIVSLTIEGFGGHAEETIEISREEWNALSPAGRVEKLEDSAAELAADYVTSGWHIDDPEDYAATEG